MSVDDDRVRQIINEAIAKAGSGGDVCCGAIGNAWRALKAQRDVPPKPGETPASLDLELAAAENYMYARFSVCTGFVGRWQMQQLAMLYYESKLIGIDSRTSGDPQSPHDMGVANWGLRGANEGEADRKRCNPNANPPLWRPINEIMGKKTYGGGMEPRTLRDRRQAHLRMTALPPRQPARAFFLSSTSPGGQPRRLARLRRRGAGMASGAVSEQAC